MQGLRATCSAGISCSGKHDLASKLDFWSTTMYAMAMHAMTPRTVQLACDIRLSLVGLLRDDL